MKKVFLLCLFLLIAIFSSCNKAGDPVDPVNPSLPNEIPYFKFVKVTIHPSYYYLPSTEYITEWMVGNTIGLSCGIYPYELPESLNVKITTFGGDIEFIELFENLNVWYAQGGIVPRQYISYFFFT